MNFFWIKAAIKSLSHSKCRDKIELSIGGEQSLWESRIKFSQMSSNKINKYERKRNKSDFFWKFNNIVYLNVSIRFD